MPPKQRFTREMILQTAIDIIDRDGIEGLSHRSIAAELKCSTQPVMSNFKTMDEVRFAARQSIDRDFTDYVLGGMREHPYAMDGALLAYIQYAIDHPNRFLFLVLDSRIKSHGPLLLATADPTPMLEDLASSAQLKEEGLRQLYRSCWLYAHGVAAANATGTYPHTMEELKPMLSTAIWGMIGELKKRGFGKEA